jgi:hypothetical protein
LAQAAGGIDEYGHRTLNELAALLRQVHKYWRGFFFIAMAKKGSPLSRYQYLAICRVTPLGGLEDGKALSQSVPTLGNASQHKHTSATLEAG